MFRFLHLQTDCLILKHRIFFPPDLRKTVRKQSTFKVRNMVRVLVNSHKTDSRPGNKIALFHFIMSGKALPY